MYKITVVVVIVLFLLMVGACVTLLSLIILLPSATTFLQSQVNYYNISTIVVKNMGSTKLKQILPQVLPFENEGRY